MALVRLARRRTRLTEQSATSIEFHDEGLAGAAGARSVLATIAANPGVQRVALSSNALGDVGVAELAIGISQLRAQGRLAVGMTELNLSNNSITDVGLTAIVQHLLLPSETGAKPTLRTLFLSGNRIRLSPSTPAPALLALALSHRHSSLRTLSMTNNPIRKHTHIAALLRHLQPKTLRTLCLNVCQLDRRVGPIFAEWLSDPARGGASLEQLELNGNGMGVRGAQPIVDALNSGAITSLLALEVMANQALGAGAAGSDDEADGSSDDAGSLGAPSPSSSPGNASPFADRERDLFRGALHQDAVRRNQVLRAATIRAACVLLRAARVVLHAVEAAPSTASLHAQVSASSFGFDSLRQALAQPVDTRRATAPTIIVDATAGFRRFTSLPSELQTHILRCLLLLDPVVLPPPFSPSLACPLSELQLAKVLAYAQDRRTLRSIDVYQPPSSRILWLSGLVRTAPAPASSRSCDDDPTSPRARFLATAGCQRWDRGALRSLRC